MMIAMPVNNPREPPKAEISPGVCQHRKDYFDYFK